MIIWQKNIDINYKLCNINILSIVEYVYAAKIGHFIKVMLDEYS